MQHRNTAYKSGKYKVYPHVVMVTSPFLINYQLLMQHRNTAYKSGKYKVYPHVVMVTSQISDQLSVVLKT